MKRLILLLSVFLLFPVCALAKAQTYKIDLDNDGQAELITAEDKYDTDLTCVITVSDYRKSNNNSFSMPEHFDKIEFISLNKDSFKQIVAWSLSGAHYTNLAIYGYKDGKLYEIFKNGSACPVKTDWKANNPIIKIGRANWEQKGWCYASGEPLWQTYTWNRESFQYSSEMSTAEPISEKEEVQRYVDRVLSVKK